MATEAILQNLSFPTAVNLSANQYCAVSVDNTGHIVLATTGKNMDGILQNNPNNDTATVGIAGRSKAVLGSTVAIADLLEVGANGVLIEHASGTPVAKALDAGASGNIISVLILKSNALYA
jgi:hypothetical protein